MRSQTAVKRVTAYALAVLLSLAVLFPASATQAYASGRAVADIPLLGSGAADEVNIVKIMDMALNKAGMSMSPSKIREFLQYWWSSVSSDIQILMNDADTTITTVSDFVEYVASAASDPTQHDGLKMMQLTLRFARFCAVQESKILTDYYNLLTRESLFRKFLLSFVTDQESNVVESIGNNKLAKYKLKSELVNMVRQAAESFIEEYEGYYLIKTFKAEDLLPSSFQYPQQYSSLVASAKTLSADMVLLCSYQYSDLYLGLLDNPYFVGSLFSSGVQFTYINKSWSSAQFGITVFRDEMEPIDFSAGSSLSATRYTSGGTFTDYLKSGVDRLYFFMPITIDGRSIRVWKSLDTLKNHNFGKSDIYYSNAYSAYDSGTDNSVEFTGSYYSNTSTNYSHQNIQNTIDNSSEVNESTVNNIVNNYITNVTNNYGGGDGSGDDENPDDWWHIGDGIEAFIKGVASLLDFILKLLGGLVDLLGKFLTSVLDVLSGLTALGQGFGDFLGAAFTFLPEECVSLIISSIAAMCVVGVVKAFIK